MFTITEPVSRWILPYVLVRVCLHGYVELFFSRMRVFKYLRGILFKYAYWRKFTGDFPRTRFNQAAAGSKQRPSTQR